MLNSEYEDLIKKMKQKPLKVPDKIYYNIINSINNPAKQAKHSFYPKTKLIYGLCSILLLVTIIGTPSYVNWNNNQIANSYINSVYFSDVGITNYNQEIFGNL